MTKLASLPIVEVCGAVPVKEYLWVPRQYGDQSFGAVRAKKHLKKCFCGDRLEHIHSTPSGAHYVKNKLGHMKRLAGRRQSDKVRSDF